MREEYSDDEDEDYVLEQDPLYKKDQKSTLKQVIRTQRQKQRVIDIYKDMKRQEQEKIYEQVQRQDQVDIRAILNKLENTKENKKIRFAGQDYLIDQQGELQLIKDGVTPEQNSPAPEQSAPVEQEQEENYRAQLCSQLKYAKGVIEMLNSKIKNINSIVKSQLDWKHFTEKNKIQKELNLNRKDGYLNRQSFLNRVNHKIRKGPSSRR